MAAMPRGVEGAILPGSVYQIRQTLTPLIPSSITTFVSTLYFSLRVVHSISFLAPAGLRQGMKNELPRLKLFQLT